MHHRRIHVSRLAFHYLFLCVKMDVEKANESKELTKNCLNDVVDALRNPLTGRNVLIPMGRQAFRRGTLRPSLIHDDVGYHEQVTLRLTGQTTKATREIARRKVESKISPNKLPRKSIPEGSKEKRQKTPPQSSSSLPCFEIREEYNVSGPVKGEAINITEHLQHLQENCGEAPTYEEPSFDADETIPDVEKNIYPLSDSEFDALSSRLDDLARLEEEAESDSKANKISSKKVQGKGWGRGFLNKKPKTKKKVSPQPAASASSTMHDTSKAANRKVTFNNTNGIQEIPRVGERSARELRPPASQQQNTSAPAISESVLSANVQERHRPMASPHPAPPQAAPSRVSRFARDRAQNAESIQTQRVSRFAKQRQGQK